MEKGNSFTTLNLVFLLMKTILDCVARIVLFSAWLYVQNEGQFSSTKTVIAYYSTLMVLVLFNAYFTKRKKNVTRRNIAGNHLYIQGVPEKTLFSVQRPITPV